MKRFVILGAILLAGAATTVAVSRKGKAHNEIAAKLYRCPMPPKYTSDKPGNCPICGRKLVPGETEGEETSREVPEKTAVAANSPNMEGGANKVMGYYNEVTNTRRDNARDDFIRKQKMKNEES